MHNNNNHNESNLYRIINLNFEKYFYKNASLINISKYAKKFLHFVFVTFNMID